MRQPWSLCHLLHIHLNGYGYQSHFVLDNNKGDRVEKQLYHGERWFKKMLGRFEGVLSLFFTNRFAEIFCVRLFLFSIMLTMISAIICVFGNWKQFMFIHIHTILSNFARHVFDNNSLSVSFKFTIFIWQHQDKKSNLIFVSMHPGWCPQNCYAIYLLQDAGIAVDTLATDRHPQVISLMKKEFNQIKHQFDIWHLAKSLTKKLKAASNHKDCEELTLWSRSIVNHLWWSSETCGGSVVQLKV